MLIKLGEHQAELDITEESGKTLIKLLDIYSRHFDIALNQTIMGASIPAVASFRLVSGKYMLSKKAKIWAAECNEYAFFFAPPTLDAETFNKTMGLLEAEEAELVKPHPEHMYTYLSAVIITDGITDEAKALIRRYKWRKSYRFSLQGWCHIRAAALDISDNILITNRDGKQLRKALGFALEGKKKLEGNHQ